MASHTFRLPTYGRPAVSEDLLTVELLRDATGTTIRLVGCVDVTTSHLLTETADLVLGDRPPHVLVIDLSQLRLLSADGVRALLRLRAAATPHNTGIVLRNPSATTRSVLDATEVTHCFVIEDTDATA